MLTSSMQADSGKPLEEYLWKKRLILFSTQDPSSSERIGEKLSKAKEGIIERHLEVIDVSVKPTRIPGTIRPDAVQIAQIRDFAKIDEKAKTVFILVGKDGTIKARQTGELDLDKFFALIDTMPMRQQEIRKAESR